MPTATSAVPFARQVLDALPLTIYTVDLDGRITSANDAWSCFARENGAPQLAEERVVAGMSVLAAIGGDGERAQLERAMALLRTGRTQVVSWEFPCSSPDEERIFLMQVTPLYAAHDTSAGFGVEPGASLSRSPGLSGQASPVSGFVLSTVNITPSHQSREALIDAGIALSRTIDLDRLFHEVGQQARRALRCDAFVVALADDDSAALRVAHQYGYLPHAEGERPTAAAVEALERELAPGWLDALANGRVVLRHAARGLEFIAPMTTAEGVIGAISMVADAGLDSPQRLDEARRVLATIAAQTAAAIERAWLVRRVEHKRRLEAIGEVAAGVAHELRNPLFGISSAAQLLRFRAKDDPVVEKNVARILREVDRLNRMLTSLLEFGRPRAPRLAPADPDGVWDDVLDVERGRLEARALSLRRLRPDRPARCALDAEQLGQVFVNVLVNAADAAPEGSELSLHSTVLPNGAWRCRLHNPGPAIPQGVLPRVFELFYSTKPGGTGIGLALCQRIVEEHRGTIALESTPEAGTTVTIVLPGGE